METINKSILFKKAHAMAKNMKGDYKACFALALRILYRKAKKKNIEKSC